jgi:N6-adenosine-specific RNA methylase IME4
LSEADKIETALKKKHYLKEIGRNKMIEGGRNGGKKALSIIDKGSHNTQKTVSKDLGMSTGKLAMAEKVMKNLDLWEKVRSEELTVGGAYKELRKQEVKTEKKIKHEEERANISKEIIPFSGTYDLILSDPPWRYDFSETESRKIENQYETADVPEIEKHIPPSNDNCILLLWATAPKLQEAFTVMKAWGFEYKTCAVWDKVNIGMGYWFRGQHEILLVGTKGKVSPPADFLRVSSVFTEKRTKHSKKPECVYKWIEDTFPSLKKLEMYCRTPRAGWSVWGNEV